MNAPRPANSVEPMLLRAEKPRETLLGRLRDGLELVVFGGALVVIVGLCKLFGLDMDDV